MSPQKSFEIEQSIL